MRKGIEVGEILLVALPRAQFEELIKYGRVLTTEKEVKIPHYIKVGFSSLHILRGFRRIQGKPVEDCTLKELEAEIDQPYNKVLVYIQVVASMSCICINKDLDQLIDPLPGPPANIYNIYDNHWSDTETIVGYFPSIDPRNITSVRIPYPCIDNKLDRLRTNKSSHIFGSIRATFDAIKHLISLWL